MDDFLKKMAHLRSDFRDVQQHIDAKVDNILEMLASMQQHLQMQEMSKGKEVGVSLCCAEIHSQHQIVTSTTSSEEAESRAKVHLENLELVFEKPYENAKLQSCSEKPVLMCAQQVFDEISKLEKLEILDAPLLTCEHKFDKVPESTLIVSNYADFVRKVDAYVCPLGVLDLTEAIEKIVAPLENFQSIEVSLNTKMIEREETKLKIGDDKKFDPGGDAILEVAGYDGCGQLKAEEKEGKLELSDYRVKDWHWEQEEHKNCGLNGLWRGKILPDFGVVTPVEAPSQVNDQYFTDLLLESNARLDGVGSFLAMIVVGGVGTVSSSVPTGNKEVSVPMFDRPLPKPPPQFRYLSREDTTRSRGKYCYGNGRVRCGEQQTTKKVTDSEEMKLGQKGS